MGVTTGIAWTDHTANFWRGCQRVSPGCEHCYAEALVTGRMGLPVWGPSSTTERLRSKAVWKNVLRWNRDAAETGVRRRVFVSSLADIFEDHPQVAAWRAEALALLADCTSLDVQLLTKRPEHILQMVPPAWLTRWPDHVWVGTTVEDQARAEARIPRLLRVPARVRFLSCEPLLGPVDLARWLNPRSDGKILCDECCWKDRECDSPWHRFRGSCGVCRGTGVIPKLSWVIVGGESGSDARPFDLAWVRSIVGQCREAGVSVFVKQLGDNPIEDGQPLRVRGHHGAEPSEWPADLRVQEFPR